MAGFQSGDDEEVIWGINVTPMVDIMLVLLVIFMVTASYIVREQIEVDLPKAASGDSEVESTLTLTVTEEGDYYLDGDAITLEELAPVVEETVDEEANSRAIIAADKKVEYGRVIELIDTIKDNGLETFALNIEKEQGADR